MLEILGRIPNIPFYVAVSGGTDSMALLTFLMKYPRNRFEVLHFNHGTDCCDEAEQFVSSFCSDNKIDFHVGHVQSQMERGESREQYWRNERYGFFAQYTDRPILLAHQLSDCVETWIMSSLKGYPSLIPYRSPVLKNIIRPLLITSKCQINEWNKSHQVEYVFDKSNNDTTIQRNYVRNKMMDNVKFINPGIETTIKKKILSEFESQEKQYNLEEEII